MFAMHAPDGYLEHWVAAGAGVISVMVVGVALRRASVELRDRDLRLAAVTAAFLFAAQMFNFPVLSGTTGHLIGGALAAVLLGPWVGTLVVTTVLVVQAVGFADGGITALGYNTLNMAIVPAFGGWAVFRLIRRALPANGGAVVGATALAAAASVVLSAMAFSFEWLLGATAAVPFESVFAAMVGVHGLIGIGEAVMSTCIVGAVLLTRPDLVYGARDLAMAPILGRRPIGARVLAVVGVAVALFFATVVSQVASTDPDGLERVAADKGFAASAQEPVLADSVFADYATSGLGNEALSLALAGAAGVVLTLLVGYGLVSTSRRLAP